MKEKAEIIPITGGYEIRISNDEETADFSLFVKSIDIRTYENGNVSIEQLMEGM